MAHSVGSTVTDLRVAFAHHSTAWSCRQHASRSWSYETGFYLGIVQFLVSLVMYGICMPLWRMLGATIGYVTTSLIVTWITLNRLQEYVPLMLREAVGRTNDVTSFIKSRLVR